MLFDMDGVLLDSRAVVERTWRRWAARHGISPDPMIRIAHGRRSSDTLRATVPELATPAEVAWLDAAELEDFEGIVPVPGALELLASLPVSQWTVVTSASRLIAERRLDVAGFALPPHAVTSEAIPRGKPAPDGYLLAASRLGVKPDECLVVEDAPPGIAAGRAAGANVLGLTTTHAALALAEADAIVPDLRGVRAEVTLAGRMLRVSVALCICAATSLSAQPRGYRLARGDTVRYHELTLGRVDMRAGAQTITVTSRHDADVAIARDAGDTVSAWYERLELSQAGPGGVQNPATDSALRRPFRLLLPANGAALVLSAPLFPAGLAALTDLSHQFEDFFIALGPGSSWADTVTSTLAGRQQDRYESFRVRTYRVLRDTLVAGARAIVISVDQIIEMRATSRMDDEGSTAGTVLEGREQGIAVFSPATGRLLGRQRQGRLTGHLIIERTGQRAELPETYEYTSTITLQR